MPQAPDEEPGKSPKVLKVEILPPKDEDDNAYTYSGFQKREQPFNTVWTYSSFNNPGCLSGAVTFGLFLILTAQYGLLAGIGFIVFNIIGSIAILILGARNLGSFILYSSWPMRLLNWTACVLLTIWLAGG